MSRSLHLAIDLGAGSGRAILGGFGPEGLQLREVHRFHYPPRDSAGHLRWDFVRLFDGVKEGLRRAHEAAPSLGASLGSVGVDSWGVDYGLFDAWGRLLEDPITYRDPRTQGTMEEVFAMVPREEIFERTGIQFMPFNTLYQLFAHRVAGLPEGAARLLMIPDAVHYRLTGRATGEYTNASTTQLLNARTRDWDAVLFTKLALPRTLMPELAAPGTVLGPLDDGVGAELALPPLEVVVPATHDTASAVVGAPLEEGWAYISSGTWSLVGVERRGPLLGPEAATANFTNEGGAFGTIRFLKNVMGLWILESCRREWASRGLDLDHETLLARAGEIRGFSGFLYPDHPRFFNPASMIAEVETALRETGHDAPTDPVALAKVILDSLALRYASVLRTIESLTGQRLAGVRVIGGGARNAYLNQATADAAGLVVLAGPAEATAIGNLVVQAVACNEVSSLADARRQVDRSVPPRRFDPSRTAEWREAQQRYAALEPPT
jgi:rhamnulokinase